MSATRARSQEPKVTVTAGAGDVNASSRGGNLEGDSRGLE
jgi:hypothetical protein